ncbi:MAG: YeiH family putative sulfate export transporter [Gammaproteobacteria bacterium]|nr:MAG: YeiH family putative sulfate export transporter [Gammaproteobacteria bacterium]
MVIVFREYSSNTIKGVLFVALFSVVATYLATFDVFQQLAISPLIIGIVLGMLYGNMLRRTFPQTWQPGIIFSTKTILRAGIVFYGFRLTFQDVAIVGFSGITLSLLIVSTTFVFGYLLGTKLLKLDRDTTILISAGSSICGAAAVLATEPVLKSQPYKTSIAVATVVVFGTISMFLYPFIYQSGLLALSDKAMGGYLGGTLHEVAHVVGAGFAINEEVANTAVIVKMLRVMLLAPFLIVLGLWLQSKVAIIKGDEKTTKPSISIPWFALGFIAIVGFNSLNLLPLNFIDPINSFDTFALTMAMTALGMETRIEKFKGIGFKPFYLATILFFWLMITGYILAIFLL